MKACIVLQNQYAKLGHAIALNLKKKYGIEQFCTYLFSPFAHDFIRQQSDIKYDPILIDHELHEKYKQENIDISFIKYFEEKYAPPNLWIYFYSDRKLMMSMGPKEESMAIIDPLYQHEDLLRIFQARAKAIEKFLMESKPDFILFFAIGALGNMILYHVAKKMDIPTYTIDFARIGNYVCLTGDYKRITQIEEYQKIYEKSNTDCEQEKKIIQQFRDHGSLHIEGFELYSNLLNASIPKITKLSMAIRYYFYTLPINYLKNRNIFLYGNTAINPFLAILYKIKEKIRQWIGLEDLYSEPDYEEDYAFFPLHVEPEISILLLSPFYFDQVALIRQIAMSLPLHYKLYIKEHPMMKNKRPREYYKQLLKIPNVKLINPNVASFNIIKGCKLVTTITGSAGWEATLLGKPVITFGNVFYNDLSFVQKIKSMEDLPNLIRKQIDEFNFNETELLSFIKALLANSVPLNFANLWFVNDMDRLETDKGVNKLCELLMKKVRDKINN